MIDSARVREILSEICEDVTPKRSKMGFISRCPVCGDSKKSKRIKRLHTDYYSSYNDWVCTCYNGGCPFHSGNIYSLYATVKGISFSEAKKYINDDVYDSGKIISALSGSRVSNIIETITVQNILDLNLTDCIFQDYIGNNTILLRYKKVLTEFLENRCIPQEYRDMICICYRGRYQGRVILPIYLNNKMVYFQSRSLFPNITPKYLNPDIDKSLIISNSDRFSRDKYIILTEGLIDSWMVEEFQGTSVNGGYFSDELIEKLLSMTDKGVIVVFDNPKIDKAGKEGLMKFWKESRFFGKVGYFIIPDKISKDLNDFKRNNKDIHIYEYIVNNFRDKWITEMNLKLNGWISP